MNTRKNEKIIPWACIVPIVLAVGLSACGGGGSGATATTAAINTDGETLSAKILGIAVPANVSAVPAQNTSPGASSAANSFAKSLRAIAKAVNPSSDLAATTDYAKATPSVYVEERALEQFEIIEKVMQMLAQTNYADAVNVNQGPYQAIVAWEDEQNGRDTKTMQTWTVDSRMIVETLPSDVTGNTTGDINRFLAWIPDTNSESGEEELLKVEFKIYTPPTKASDGSLLDFGEWDMNVLFGANTTGTDVIPTGGASEFFAASARINASGVSTLKVHEKFTEAFDGLNEVTEELRGILTRNGDNGYGAVQYPDWSSCRFFEPSVGDDGDGPSSSDNTGSETNPCASEIPVKNAKYSYNENYMSVQEIDENGTASPVVNKDRDLNQALRLVHRYELFYADDGSNDSVTWSEGDNIKRHTNFGFPVSYSRVAADDPSVEFNDYSYYGAWQGRHQIWGQGLTATTDGTDGTTFTRQDVGSGEIAATYKMIEFNGTLAKRDVVTADLDDIKDIAVETWINDSYDMFWDDTNLEWKSCDNGYMDFWTDKNNLQCMNFDNQVQSFSIFDAYADLAPDASGKKWVNISRWNDNGTPSNPDDDINAQYIYYASDPTITGLSFTGEGFYIADEGQNGLAAKTDANGGGLYTPDADDKMYINISGSLYIMYTGNFTSPNTGWVIKEVTAFDNRTWQPTFGENDTSFDPARGTEYYLNANGSNYIVKRRDESNPPVASDYEVMLELQTAANPVNIGDILPTGTSYLAAPWASNIRYSFVTAPDNANYMKLIYLTDDPNTQDVNESAITTVLTKSEWGLQPYNASDVPLGLSSDGNVVSVTVDDWGFPEGDVRPTEFNWEYSEETGGWGAQQYLVDASTITDYIILSDPIRLVNVGLYDNLSEKVTRDGNALAGDESNWKKVSLQYDGWMQGMPDLYFELEKAGWDISGMGDKVRLLIEGQEVVDAAGVRYFIKPMDTSLFLATVTTFPNGTEPDISLADQADLSSVPGYTPHGMGATPTEDADGDPLVVKYSEGQPL